MSKFIYVFDKDIADALIDEGFDLIKCDDIRGVYVFENRPGTPFTFSEKELVYSNTLTF